MKYKYCIILLAFVHVSCKSQSKSTESETDNDSTLSFETKPIEEKLVNADKTLMLVLNYQQTIDIPITFNYSVVKLSSDKVIKTGSFTGTRMVWSDLYTIKGYLYQGIIRKQDEIIDEKNLDKPNENFIIINLEKEAK